jgi:hypothetical protein
MSAPIAFVDTETDGIHSGRKVWEVAVVRREPDGTEVPWQAFVDIDLSTADPFGLRVGRFYDRHPLGRDFSGLDQPRDERGPGWIGTAHAARRVARLTHGAHVVGAVPSFDTEVLDRLLRGHGLIPAWHYHLICVEVLAVGYLRAKGVEIDPPYSSEELAETLVGAGRLSAAEHERHTAMSDVRFAMRMYDAIMGGGS